MINIALVPLLASLASAAASDPVDCSFEPTDNFSVMQYFALSRKMEFIKRANLEALTRERARLHEESYTDLVGDVMAGRLSEDDFNAAAPTSPALRLVDAKIRIGRAELEGTEMAQRSFGDAARARNLRLEPFMAVPAESNWLLQMTAESPKRVPVEIEADSPEDAERRFTEQYLAAGFAKEDFTVSCRPRFSPERP